MNEKQLRALVREEVERVLDEETQINSHPKFRRLVEHKRGQAFNETDEFWAQTYECWNEALTEAGGTQIDQETLDYYVDRAIALIEN